MNKKPELILPAGDPEKARFALEYGADAVYLGLPKYSMRKGEVRFTIPQIAKVIEYAHKKNKKVYITFNIFAHDKHLKTLPANIQRIAKFKPDAFVIADMGVLKIIKDNAPLVPIHVSTQQNTVNTEAVKFWKEMGVKRVILARELTLKEIKNIHDEVPDMELEMFVHGAMCISYSGRCLLSAYMTGREANLGDCAQPCRWAYDVKYKTSNVKSTDVIPSSAPVIPSKAEESLKKRKGKGSLHSSLCEVGRDDTPSVIPAIPPVIPAKAGIYLEEKLRPEEYFPIEEDENGTYIMNSKDLCLIKELDKVLYAGITGLKVEGRNKSIYYLGVVTRAYRKALDAIEDSGHSGLSRIFPELTRELETLNYRGYTSGFALGKAKKGETYPSRQPVRNYNFVAVVRRDNKDCLLKRQSLQTKDMNYIEVRNQIKVGDNIEVIMPSKASTRQTFKESYSGREKVLGITDASGKKLNVVNPGKTKQMAYLKLKNVYPEMTLMRKEI
jgi:putative protease